MADKIIQVLIVDDSAVSRDLLTHIVESDPTLHVMGTANNGEEALSWLEQHKPDIVLMDIAMPKMNGFETTRQIMERSPLPIIIVSGIYNPLEGDQCYQAISAGALAILEKPTGILDPKNPEMAHAILQAIKTLAGIKIKFPIHITIPSPAKTPTSPLSTSSLSPVKEDKPPIGAVGIGASIAGPQALHTILSNLPALFPVPIFIVQQIPAGFTKGLVDWLAQSFSLKIKLASQGEMAVPGYMYVAPDNYHLKVAGDRLIQLSTHPLKQGFRPSIDHLFWSFDKPKKAIQAEAAKQIIPLSQIPHALSSLAKVNQNK